MLKKRELWAEDFTAWLEQPYDYDEWDETPENSDTEEQKDYVEPEDDSDEDEPEAASDAED